MDNDKTDLINQENSQFPENTLLLNAILDHTPIMIAYMDTHFNFIRVNRAYAKADNKEITFFPGKNHFTLYPNPENEQIFRKVVETGISYIIHAKPSQYEEHPERGLSYWDWSLIPIKNTENLVEGLVLTVQNVTEWWETEIKLRASEEKLKQLNELLEKSIDERIKELKSERDKLEGTINGLSIAGIGIDVIDSEYNVLFQNQILKDRFGTCDKKYCYENYMNKEQPCDFCPMIKAVENSEIVRVELKGADGRDYEIISAPLPKDEEKIDKAIEIILDITERKKTEIKLRESEEKYRLLVERLPVSVFRIVPPPPYRLSEVNSATVKIYGYDSAEELLKTPILDLYADPEDGKLVAQEILEKGGIFNKELRMKKKDGTVFWASISSQITYTKEGIPAWTDGVTVDITETKLAELKLKESEEKFRTITEESFLALAIIQDDVVKYANQKMADLVGYSIEEIINWKPREYLKIFAPDSIDIVLEQVKKKQFGDPDVIVHYPIHVVKKAGELIWVDNISKTIMYNGRPADLVTEIDITERLKAEQVIKNEIKRIKEIDQIKDDLIRRISHELKTPLISIYSTSDYLLNNYLEKLDENCTDLIKIIYKGGERLKTLVDNLIDIYLLESHELKLNSKSTNLSSTIRNAVSNISPQLNKRKHKLDVDLPKELIIIIDGKRIQQVISNILMNSINYTQPKGNISVNLSENEAYVDIKISDNGIGFTEEEKERLFTKFGKIERFGKGLKIDVEGPGLGLFIANEIVKLHKGKILFHSAGRYQGSTFTIRLPSGK
ncbi:MAG: PAS domain S-box protein [Promethearchaeota archaeon]